MLQSQRLFTLLSIFFLSQFAFAQTTYTVTSTSKDGPGSINEAIDFANINPGADIIEFTPGLQINATHLGYIPGGLADYMLNITESVTIDGKGGALIGSQRWIDGSGDWNSLIACPGNIPSGSILAAMPNFMQVGTIGVDNTGITVTVKNLSIEQFNSIAEVRDNAVLEFENFNAKKIWSTLSCLPRSLLNAGTGSSISIKNSQFTDTKNWGTLGFASEINSLNAGDLTIENTLFFNNNGGDSFAISWDGQANSKVNIVSSRFLSSGGIQVSGNVSVSNIVNSIWVNRDTENPKFGDRIINDASGDMNITASSLMWNNNNCDFSCQTEQNSRPLIVRKGAGKINFIQSAIGINFPSGSATLVNTLGNTGTGDGFTADDNTYIQPTTIQDATALKTITSQPSLYTTGIGTAFNNEVLSYTFNFDVEMVTPAFPGELIDQILSNKVLLHPITNAPITEDVLGNDRVDANGDRNIGAIQVSLAPFLSLVGIGEGIVDLGWTEPLHHDGLPILRYEIEYFDGGFNPISIIIDPPVLSKTISSLANGTEHTFYVRAIYDNGGVEAEGPLSNEVAATPLGSMIAPTLTATPGNTEVALSWNLPDLGGRTFQQYTILWYEQVSGDFVGAHTIADPNETTYIVTGLTNGTIYDFKITARASEDTSPAGTASATPDALPIAICQPFTAQLDANGTVTILPSDVDGGSSDPDGGSVTLSLDNDTFTCADIGINTVTLTVTNNVSPNSTATCTAAVTVVDNIAPVIACPADLTVNTNPSVCFATVSFPDALATDYCGIDTVVQTGGLPTGSMFPVGVNTVEYTATDVNGNTAVCSFTITVTDNEPAVAVCQDITIQLDANGDATIVAADVDGGSTDNCGIASIAIDIDTFTCADVGPNDVILTVTDGNGNVSSCIAVVTVEDVTAPVAVCMDITVQLDATGTITILGSDVDGGSSDACGIASFDLDIDTFDCTNVGPNTVTVTVTDVNGNVSTCTAVVTVEDVTMPELVCMDITLELGADGTAMITPADVSTATDACGINTTAVDIENFDCSDIGTPVTVTVFAVDNNGNLQSCNALVTVVDLFAPVVTCPADQTVDPGPGNLFYEVPDYFATGEATATDNCTDPLTIFSQDPAPGTLLPDGTYTVTMSAEDEYGNVGTCAFELTVESVLGINDNGIDISTIVMNPNPAIYVVNISNPQNIELEQAVIYDVTGRLVQTYDLKDMGTEKALDISMLSTAAYVVMIQGPEGQVTKQLIKE